jgi:flagellar M-ring protein FliF
VTDTPVTGGERSQTRLILIMFACVAAILGLSYYFFLRTAYVPLYSDLRPADASAIVTELDRQGISYRLSEGGTTILVADSESDAARLAIAGSNLPINGLVGFELFNESDLGLTDFTQKINYQRALQGELARTIMMMGGIDNARVHLAIPERSLFRGNRSETRAAVTVVPSRGRALDEGRVAGIQRLIASSVPELALANVVVLDDLGRVISSTAAGEALPPQLEERAGAEAYYRARIRAAVEQILPANRFDIRVAAVSHSDVVAVERAGTAAPPPREDGATRTGRQFRLRITFLSSVPLDADQQAQVLAAVRGAAELDEELGDRLIFPVGPTDMASLPVPPRPISAPGAADAPPVRPIAAPDSGWWPGAPGAIAAMLAVLAILIFLRGRGKGLAAGEREAFVRRLRAELRRSAEQSGA